MKKEEKNIIQNKFFTRACCGIPKPYDSEKIFKHSCAKLDSHDPYKDLIPTERRKDCYVEVRFKNSKKDFFKVPAEMHLQVGDFVAVEAANGHDIGIVSLTGHSAKLQMKKKLREFNPDDIKSVYRRARPSDIEKWIIVVEKEDDAQKRTIEISGALNLEMKINDVEFQGDGTKATFYYTAEDRVDFRELIKVLADEFKVRIEMRQIGARQEAAKLGGLGSCGRELCCSTWITNFTSVSTQNARTQQLSLNPKKLAGQCGKLKCCLKYENSTYEEALKEFPASDVLLKSKKGNAKLQKIDVFKKILWYSYTNEFSSMMAIPLDEVKKIVKLNSKGKLVDELEKFAKMKEQANIEKDDFDPNALKQFEDKYM